MTITHILIFAIASFPFMWLVPAQWRPWGLLLGSVGAVAWLMGADLFTQVDLILLMASLVLILMVWWVIQPSPGREDRVALGVMLAVVGVVALFAFPLTSLPFVFGSIGLLTVSTFSLSRVVTPDTKQVALLLVGLIVLLLVILKIPAVAAWVGLTLQSDITATASPLVWLGFSYMAFRMMGMLLDYRSGQMGAYSLRDVAIYVLFFPAFTAGPIDRAQRFIPELESTKPLDSGRIVEGGGRIAVGVVKKFVLADSLALISMNPELINQTTTTAGLWLLVYLYTFQIYLDFSGYSDVAIGLGRLYGITLPENFNRPYLQRNIQQFWQRWHITLSTWFRVYYFMPLTRAMIRSPYKIPQWGMVFIAQTTTMLLIGLWHGVTLNFLLWGLWHGVGLFLHKMLADNTRTWNKRVDARVWSRRGMAVVSVLMTFHFVALGWVFFALPDVNSSFMMFARLFGGG